MDHALAGRAPARPPVTSFILTEVEAPSPRLAQRLLRAPGWAFHLACGLGALGVLWAASAPASPVAGGDLRADPFAWLGLACALAWGVRLVLALARGRVDWAYLLTPAIGLAVAATIYLDAPLQTRWLQAEDGFERTLRALPAAKEWDPVVVAELTPSRIGSYQLERITRDSGGAVQFHLDGGAAFTYLVPGVTAETTEANPGAHFEHLHGNWYLVRAR